MFLQHGLILFVIPFSFIPQLIHCIIHIFCEVMHKGILYVIQRFFSP